jgi:SPP1 family predicted phage head-tail adaptor
MINAFSLKVALLKVSDATDEYGKQRFEITSSKEMMAIPTNITRSEFYEASRSGYKVSRIIRINSFLYQAERYILIDGKVYKVIKTYELSHLLELTLESTNLKVEGKWLV